MLQLLLQLADLRLRLADRLLTALLPLIHRLQLLLQYVDLQLQCIQFISSNHALVSAVIQRSEQSGVQAG